MTTFFDCIQNAVDAGFADKFRGETAQKLWKELRDKYRRLGHDDQMADALAAQDVKAAARKKAGDDRHRFLAEVAAQRKAMADINNATPEQLATSGTDLVEYMDHRKGPYASLVGQTHALRRLFNARLQELAEKHYPRILSGETADPANLKNIAIELHGKSTDDVSAKAFAKAVREAFTEMRRMFNEAGGLIGELADWGLPHKHDKLALSRTKFEDWADYRLETGKSLREALAWHRIEDFLTGRPMAAEGAMPSRETQDEFLRSVYDNNVFGEGSKEAVYGRMYGKNLVRQHAESRILHFNDPEDWIAYNKVFGSGDIYGTIMAHASRMAEDIVVMRNLGASPEAGLSYRKQLAVKRARELGDNALKDKIDGNYAHAGRMLEMLRGGHLPDSLDAAVVARHFATGRHILTSALLDRAIISAISDLNTARLAAKAMGMKPGAIFKRHMSLLFSGASKSQLARGKWVSDVLTDPGLILARWQTEVPAARFAERLASGVMRVQGLSKWTNDLRQAFWMETTGVLADYAGKPLSEVGEPFRSLLISKGLTEEEWAEFSRPEFLWTPEPDATFADPMWWRVNTTLDPAKADEIYLKIMPMIEEQMEFAVPTNSLYARAAIEPRMPPGSIAGELFRSSILMVKSYQMTFSLNQISRIMAQQGRKAKAGYAFDLLAGAAVMGAISLQVGELLYGRDPQDMTDPSFWGRAALKGGGFGVIGDLVAAGESSWGGGFQSFIAGPGVQLIGDAWALSVGNAAELMTGDKTNFGRELVKFLDRYTPGADIPVLGLAMDRLFWDSLQKVLDPEAESAMRKAATKRENLYGNAPYWQPGRPLPGRAPNLGAAIGG